MNQYPTILILSPEMHYLKMAPKPASLRQFRRGGVNMYQMNGAVPLPLPRPRGGWMEGTAHRPPPYLEVDSPIYVLTK